MFSTPVLHSDFVSNKYVLLLLLLLLLQRGKHLWKTSLVQHAFNCPYTQQFSSELRIGFSHIFEY